MRHGRRLWRVYLALTLALYMFRKAAILMATTRSKSLKTIHGKALLRCLWSQCQTKQKSIMRIKSCFFVIGGKIVAILMEFQILLIQTLKQNERFQAGAGFVSHCYEMIIGAKD
uniref:Phosphoadenosine phosphosulfate reductase n=1 Tax=uncultured marine virus TaxID=186617 RepID=A0A0F7L5J8_9VIRU|nr:phosphoadenosine phosphosulfate reductase [uncultured marine virus]